MDLEDVMVRIANELSRLNHNLEHAFGRGGDPDPGWKERAQYQKRMEALERSVEREEML